MDNTTTPAQPAAPAPAPAPAPAAAEPPKPTKFPLTLSLLGLGIAGLAAFCWWFFQPAELPASIAKGNGRIEATEIDIATKLPGRISQILAKEGDFVQSGQILAKMDDHTLIAQKSEAQAQVRHAESARQTAIAIVNQRKSEHTAAEAVVAQHHAEADAAGKRLLRSQSLVGEGAMPQQEVDDNRARVLGLQAAISAAQAQVAAALAGIEAAKSQVLQSQSLIEAATATVTRIQADIDDNKLVAPRAGRVQYRVAEPGEVLAAGGRVLNIVDLSDVYMTFFLSTDSADRIALGSEIRLVLDALPDYVIPAQASFVANVAQFTPKMVETETERLKLMFRVRARIDPELLKQHLSQIKTGVPGMAYVKIDAKQPWPAELAIKLPQ